MELGWGALVLLLVAAALITFFSFALPVVWGKEPVAEKRRNETCDLDAGEREDQEQRGPSDVCRGRRSGPREVLGADEEQPADG